MNVDAVFVEYRPGTGYKKKKAKCALHQCSCSVTEKHGGAFLQVGIYRIMPYLVMLWEVEKWS